ncbi:MAG: NYN domain-containing protein [Acidobacteria bacterium]|nr:NYN domain-containing protein [Acidobacteriota bacterium]
MEERHRIAVFIDFDNIEIGVKNTLGREFDVSSVLEALKERGEVLSKIAYGDWTYHGETSRILGQHGVQMVQRHPGPRGDKNGADINLALDALEMALTKPHIDAFAIVSGDSDFISLVEKLKQYNKAVYIVGGRAFTSTILQKNCREFISYESLLSSGQPHRGGGGRGAQRSTKPGPALPLSNVTALLYRALEVLARREVQPQLGLLKSTMLQLDSSFTERDYGASSFRQFVEMLEKGRLVRTSRVHGHYLVESPEAEEAALPEVPTLKREDALPVLQRALKVLDENDLWGKLDFRGVKDYVQRLAPDFDEKRYGFGQFAELLNYAQDLGLVLLEPDADSVLRVFPGRQFRAAHAGFPTVVQSPAIFAGPPSETTLASEVQVVEDPAEAAAPEAVAEPPAQKKPKRTYHRRSRARSGTAKGSQKKTPEVH